MNTKLLFIILFLINSTLLSSQVVSNFNHLVINKLEPIKKVKPSYNGGLLFRFYKNFISSQDGSNCNFYPSCSKYASECIVQKGIFLGTLLAFDRIARCNGGNHMFYLKKSNKLNDPH